MQLCTTAWGADACQACHIHGMRVQRLKHHGPACPLQNFPHLHRSAVQSTDKPVWGMVAV